MALISCLECEKQISNKAESCPHCGYPIKNSQPITNNADNKLKNVESNPNYQPQIITKINPLPIIIGISLIGFGLFMLIFFIPEHNPEKLKLSIDDFLTSVDDFLTSVRTRKDLVHSNQKFLKKDELVILVIATITSWVALTLGTIILIIGGTKKSGELIFCKKCDIQTVAKKKNFGLTWSCERCELTSRLTNRTKLLIFAIPAFWLIYFFSELKFWLIFFLKLKTTASVNLFTWSLFGGSVLVAFLIGCVLLSERSKLHNKEVSKTSE